MSATTSRLALATVATTLGLTLFVSCRSDRVPDVINDERNLLPSEAETRIRAFHNALLSELDIELGLDIPAASPLDIDRAATETMRRRKLGERTSADRGVLLLIDVDARLVRMEVGPDLEHVFTDAFVSRVERHQLAPFFAEDRVSDGIEATIELLVAQAAGSEADAVRTGPDVETKPEDFAAGGGARAAFAPGRTVERVPPDHVTDRHPARATPEETFSEYLEVLRRYDTDPALGLYTPETRILMGMRLVTPAQQANELRQLEAAMTESRIVQRDSFAVVVFEGSATLPPYFLRLGEPGWMLDLATATRTVGFDFNNRWYFRDKPSDYAFAFSEESMPRPPSRP